MIKVASTLDLPLADAQRVGNQPVAIVNGSQPRQEGNQGLRDLIKQDNGETSDQSSIVKMEGESNGQSVVNGDLAQDSNEASNADTNVTNSIPTLVSRRDAALVQNPLIEDLVEQGVVPQEQIDMMLGISGTTYYVDCTAGNDSNSGKSKEDAWATLEAANSAELLPGDRLRFKRGCRWSGTLIAGWHGTPHQPIVISSYGEGQLPIIQDAPATNVQIRGSYLIVENLHATLSSPPNPDPNCDNQPVAWRAGFSFQAGASYNIVQHSMASNLAIGVFFGGDTHHNKANNNTIVNNHVVWELTENATLGAMGVLLQGDHQEVGYNYFADNMSLCTYTGVVESNSVELYAATNSTIHHNIAFRDRVFSEMGSSPSVRSQNNTYAYNLHVASISHPTYGARFIVTRGVGHLHGPVLGTLIYNNTVYLTGSGSKGVTCEMCEPNILTLENNILWVNREPFSSDGPFVERNNLFWSGDSPTLLNFNGFVMSETSRRTNPLFVDAEAGDFRLQPGSPAIDRGTMLSVSAFDFDLGQSLIPVGNGRDIGAFEYRRQPWQQVVMLPGRIEAEDYRPGGPGVGYYDTTPNNSGAEYREDDVDIEMADDADGEYDIGWIASGEWLSYEINAPAAGIYQADVRAATPSGGRHFRIEIDGRAVSGSVEIPWTGDWQSWVDVPVFFPLTAGRHTLRLVAEGDRFNVNYITIRKID